MRLLANENVPLASVRRLRQVGHDVASASEEMPGADDPDVLARAARDGRMLLTFDRDYGQLIYQSAAPPPPGLLFLRFRARSPEEPAERVLALLAEPGIDLAGRLTVVERDAVRQRPLP